MLQSCTNSSYPFINSIDTLQTKILATAALSIAMAAIAIAFWLIRPGLIDFGRAVVLVGRKKNVEWRWIPLFNYITTRMLVVQLVSAHYSLFGWLL